MVKTGIKQRSTCESLTLAKPCVLRQSAMSVLGTAMSVSVAGSTPCCSACGVM